MAEAVNRSRIRPGKLADYFQKPLTHVDRSIWAFLHDADRDKDPVSMIVLTSGPAGDHLRSDGALVALKGGATVELFRQWAVRTKQITPGKPIVDRGEPAVPQTTVDGEPIAAPLAETPAKTETQHLQALMDAAAKLDVLGVLVRHRGYEMRLSFEPADEEHPWVAVGHVEFPDDGEPTDVCGYGDTAEEALEACADEIDEATNIYVENPDEPEDGEDDET